MTDDATQEFGGGEPSSAGHGDLIEGRYRLEERMGGGVTATTWRAHDPVLGRDVAVKIWADASDDAHRSQQDELSAARLLDPNLNELLDAGSHDGRPFLVREMALERPADSAPPLSAAVPVPEAPVPEAPAPSFETPLTPPAGAPTAAAPRRGDRVVMASVGAILVAALLVIVGLVVRPGASERPDDDPMPPREIAPAAITSFDPEGDGEENPEKLGALLDGDPATAWNSERYNSRNFGNLKSGLGLVLTISPAQDLASIEVISATGGWSGQVHTAASPAPDLAGWGPPLDAVTGSGPSEEFDLGGRTVGAVLIWFTDLGAESNRLTISDVRLQGAG